MKSLTSRSSLQPRTIIYSEQTVLLRIQPPLKQRGVVVLTLLTFKVQQLSVLNISGMMGPLFFRRTDIVVFWICFDEYKKFVVTKDDCTQFIVDTSKYHIRVLYDQLVQLIRLKEKLLLLRLYAQRVPTTSTSPHPNTEVTFKIVEQHDQTCVYLDISLEKGQIKGTCLIQIRRSLILVRTD